MVDLDEEDLFTGLPTPEVLSPPELLSTFSTVNVLAPLVRCSKLPFRHLTSLYETHITNTPMILAEEFSRSQSARIADFSTSVSERGVFWMEPKDSGSSSVPRDCRSGTLPEDVIPSRWLTHTSSSSSSSSSSSPSPALKRKRLPPTPTPPTKQSRLVRGCLLAQMAAPNSTALADATELISPYVDGLDINCGCPQKWAFNEGIGCALLRKPELVRDMVRTVQGRMGWDWPVSIKIRVDPDLKLTDQLVKTALQANVSHITIHGRTRHQASTEPVSLPAIEFAVESIGGEVPCVGNGDVWSLEDAQVMRSETGVDAVMGARGLLANPALFAGYDKTPKHAVEQFVNLSVDYGFIFPLFHRHLAYMLESHFTRPEKAWFNSLSSSVGIIDHLSSRGLEFSHSIPMWDARRGRTNL